MRNLCIILFVLCTTVTSLKVLTFNIWVSGAYIHNGRQKIAKHIRIVNPDVVALQEVETPEVVDELVNYLGPPWVGVAYCNRTLPDTAILTRHTVVPGSYAHVDYGMSVKIQLRDTRRMVTVWSLHLDYISYGPYAAFNKLVTSENQIIAGEFPTHYTGRVQNILQLLTSKDFRTDVTKSNSVPLIVAGDFNAPSHYDWIDANKDIHAGYVIKWPASELLRNHSGVIDSFRELYPDPVKYPGYSWSTVHRFNSEWDYTIPEPLDRLDFIHYLGPLKPISSGPYCGNETLKIEPHQADNDYPSDHYAFITEFQDLPAKEDPYPIPPFPVELFERVRDVPNPRKKSSPVCYDNVYLAKKKSRKSKAFHAYSRNF